MKHAVPGWPGDDPWVREQMVKSGLISVEYEKQKRLERIEEDKREARVRQIFGINWIRSHTTLQVDKIYWHVIAIQRKHILTLMKFKNEQTFTSSV